MSLKCTIFVNVNDIYEQGFLYLLFLNQKVKPQGNNGGLLEKRETRNEH